MLWYFASFLKLESSIIENTIKIYITLQVKLLY